MSTKASGFKNMERALRARGVYKRLNGSRRGKQPRRRLSPAKETTTMPDLKSSLHEAPPIAGESDPEYQPRLDAERVSIEWRAAIRASGKQYDIDDLPLFGGERQGSLF